MNVPEKGHREPRADRSALRTVGPLLTAGIQMAAAICLAGYGGYLLDNVMGTKPWILLGGLCLGAAASIVLFIKTVNEVNRREREEDRR